jgi:hypothetical protein
MMRVDSEPEDTHAKHSMWIGIWKPILSFFIGVIVATYTVGRAGQKVRDLGIWKDQISPKIERMDSVGSLSFDHFHRQYEKDQHRIDERLKELEKEQKELQKKQKLT